MVLRAVANSTHHKSLPAIHLSCDWSSCELCCVVIGCLSITATPDRDIGPDTGLAIFRSHLPGSGPDHGHHNK